MYVIRYVKCPLFLSDFYELGFFDRFKKKKKVHVKFHKDSSGWGRVVPRGQTDRHDEGNSRFSQFCKRA
jgi:hypothetical protein